MDLADTEHRPLKHMAALLAHGEGDVLAAPVPALLDALVRVLVPEGCRVAVGEPTDPALPALIVAAGRVYVDVGRRHDFSLSDDLLAFALGQDPDIRLIHLATPAQPTGAVVPPALIRRLARGSVPILVDHRWAVDGGLRPGVHVADGRLSLLRATVDGEPSGLLVASAGDVARLRAHLADATASALATVDIPRGGVRQAHLRRHRSLASALAALPRVDVTRGAGPAVYVRVRGFDAAELVAALAQEGVQAEAYPGRLCREGVAVPVPGPRKPRAAIVAAFRHIVTA